MPASPTSLDTAANIAAIAETSLFDQWLGHQQRWWAEWSEAGQLWTSWWVSQWPPLVWPSAPTMTRTDPTPASQASGQALKN